MQQTTAKNPGAGNARKPHTLRRLGSGMLWRLRNGEFRSASNFLVSEGANMVGQARRRKRYFCNLCDYKLKHLSHSSNELRISWHSACPRCDSRKRHRGLAILYRQLLAPLTAPRIIHFAPEPVLGPLLEDLAGDYETSDYFLEDVDHPRQDIQALTFEDAIYDVALTNHVLEHVPDDVAAMSELARILKPGGIAVITIPGVWTRHQTIDFPELSNNGHYRDYGLEVEDRLAGAFDRVEAVDLCQVAGPQARALGLVPGDEVAFVCRRES